MGNTHPRPRHHAPLPTSQPHRHDEDHVDVPALIEENAQLRELVIQLSKLVIKNVVDKK